jgi:hypothetical protein
LVVGCLQAGHPLGCGREGDPVAGQGGFYAERYGQVSFAGAGGDSERLQHLRAVLPCPVKVTSDGHPLSGAVLQASGFKHWGGELLLVVSLPDGAPGTVAADATDVFGTTVMPSSTTVLSVSGARRFRELLTSMGPLDGSPTRARARK